MTSDSREGGFGGSELITKIRTLEGRGVRNHLTLFMVVPLSEKRPSIGKKTLDRVKSVSLFHNTFIGGHYFLDFFFILGR